MTSNCHEVYSVLIELNQQLLDSIHAQDWETYTKLCSDKLTAYEPEALGHLVKGLDFHKTYFDMEPSGGKSYSTISSPNVRVIGNIAVVCFIRLVQSISPEGEATSSASEETRIWEKQDAGWKHIHFHRSPC